MHLRTLKVSIYIISYVVIVMSGNHPPKMLNWSITLYKSIILILWWWHLIYHNTYYIMMLCRLPGNHLTVDYSDSRAGHAPFNIKFILIKKTGRVNVESLFINNRLYNMLTCESCKATQVKAQNKKYWDGNKPNRSPLVLYLKFVISVVCFCGLSPGLSRVHWRCRTVFRKQSRPSRRLWNAAVKS